ncbi:MAG: hypothetical protein H7263_10880, partial [Candidatus Sericytochromatia bacterium]|nr:hypothetical protein [Candidatus Sericytochromatia bacterium]
LKTEKNELKLVRKKVNFEIERIKLEIEKSEKEKSEKEKSEKEKSEKEKSQIELNNLNKKIKQDKEVVAKKLKNKGMASNDISEITGLSLEEIEKI